MAHDVQNVNSTLRTNHKYHKIRVFYCNKTDFVRLGHICVQYSYAIIVDLILMAMDQEDIEHWKEPAVQISLGILPYYQLLDKYISIKCMYSMHNFLYSYDPILQLL